MARKYRIRLISTIFILLFGMAIPASQYLTLPFSDGQTRSSHSQTTALQKLETLAVKGRAPKTGYERSQFGDGWLEKDGCSTREIILARDLRQTQFSSECKVISGILEDPYTGKKIFFKRGAATSQQVQIDHVVALSNAWQTGAQYLPFVTREALANDPLELLAVDGAANQQKGDGDAATWLPSNKPFRCQYVMRQIDVKVRYRLWVTPSEKDAMKRVLGGC